jgi:hypothetical protein
VHIAVFFTYCVLSHPLYKLFCNCGWGYILARHASRDHEALPFRFHSIPCHCHGTHEGGGILFEFCLPSRIWWAMRSESNGIESVTVTARVVVAIRRGFRTNCKTDFNFRGKSQGIVYSYGKQMNRIVAALGQAGLGERTL